MDNSSLPDGFRFRKLQRQDYSKGFLTVLAELTQVGEISQEEFYRTFQQIDSNENHAIVILQEEESGEIAGTGCFLVEQKFIHQCGKIGHIEDIVISSQFRQRGLGKKLIQHLLEIGKEKGCYKVILDCAENLTGFYSACGLVVKGVEMAIYFDNQNRDYKFILYFFIEKQKISKQKIFSDQKFEKYLFCI